MWQVWMCLKLKYHLGTSIQSKMTYFTRERITEQLTASLTGLASTKQVPKYGVNFNMSKSAEFKPVKVEVSFTLGNISPYKVSEYSLLNSCQITFTSCPHMKTTKINSQGKASRGCQLRPRSRGLLRWWPSLPSSSPPRCDASLSGEFLFLIKKGSGSSIWLENGSRYNANQIMDNDPALWCMQMLGNLLEFNLLTWWH